MRVSSRLKKLLHMPIKNDKVFNERNCSWEPGFVCLKSIRISLATSCCSLHRLSIVMALSWDYQLLVLVVSL